MNVEDVITLDNQKNYLLIEKIEYKKDNYFLGVEVNEEEIFYNHYKFFKEVYEDKELYVDEINDKELLKNLTLLMATSSLVDAYPELGEQLLEELKNEGS